MVALLGTSTHTCSGTDLALQNLPILKCMFECLPLYIQVTRTSKPRTLICVL